MEEYTASNTEKQKISSYSINQVFNVFMSPFYSPVL